MDTVYMKERAYRLVETVRRGNQREQRRLDERLFSKAGLAATHQMELSALTDEQRRIRQELTKIKKSSSTNWGLLPPRINELNNDEPIAGELSNKHSNKTRNDDHSRHHQKHRRPQEQKSFYTDLSFESLQRHNSDPGPSPFEPVNMGPHRHRNVKKRSMQQWDHENKRTEDTLRKFNQAFPLISGKVGAIQQIAGEVETEVSELPPLVLHKADEEIVDDTDMGPLSQRKEVQNSTSATRRITDRWVSQEEVDSFQINQAGNTEPELNEEQSKTVTLIQGEHSNQGNQQGTSLPSSSSSQTTKRRENMVKPKPQSSAKLPKSSVHMLPETANSNEDESAHWKNAMVDVQDARDNIARRLGGNHQSTSTKRSLGSPHGFRGLSPIREQKTELSIVSVSMPEFTTSNPSQRPQQQTRKKHHAHHAQQLKQAQLLQQAQEAQQNQKSQEARKAQKEQEALKEQEAQQSQQLPEAQASLPKLEAQMAQQIQQVHQAQEAQEAQEALDMQPVYLSPPKKQRKRGRRNSDVAPEHTKPKFDSYRYNPDGSLRTMHQLPNFNDSLREAMKARYLRHKEKQWFERELNVSEMFARD